MSTSFPTARETKVRAQAEAAAWIAKLQSPQRSEELEAGLRRWLSADPENARQFERVTEVWDAATQVGSEMRDLPRLKRWSNQTSTGRYALAAAVLLAVGLALFGAYRLWFADFYITRIGEQRLVRLEDGSRVTLNSNSRIRVQYDDARRRIALNRGEALFEATRDTARPFVVSAGGQHVTALGTSFVVRMDSDRLAVTLLEGKVTVSASESAPSQPGKEDPERAQSTTRPQRLVLSPGERATLTRSSVARIDSPRLDAVTAWRRGEVNLESTPLAEACAEMNRYDERPLVLDEPHLAELQISGIYHAGDSRAFADTMARLYGLEVVEADGKLHLRDPARP